MKRPQRWLPSLQEFVPRRFGLGAWTDHVPFGYWLVREVRPRTLVELGVHLGESYFAFCQSVQENKLPTLCYGVDTWKGDPQTGFYGEKVFAEISEHNAEFYGAFSHLLRSRFDDAVSQFADNSIDLLHIDGLHTYEAVKHDFETWLPKVREGGIVLFHDTAERDSDFGVWKLWEEISARDRSFEFHHGHGLGVLRKGAAMVAQPPLIEALFEGAGEEADAIRSHFILLADHLKLKLRRPRAEGAESVRAVEVRSDFLQAFVGAQGAFNEANSAKASIDGDGWQTVWLEITRAAGDAGLRIDPTCFPAVIEIASIRICAAESAEVRWAFDLLRDHSSTSIAGTAIRLLDDGVLRLLSFGSDPQVILPENCLDGLPTRLRIEVVQRVDVSPDAVSAAAREQDSRTRTDRAERALVEAGYQKVISDLQQEIARSCEEIEEQASEQQIALEETHAKWKRQLVAAERTQAEIVAALQIRLARVDDALIEHTRLTEEERRAWENSVEQLRAAISKLYRARRWKLMNVLDVFKAKPNGAPRHPTYWPLDEALDAFEQRQGEEPRKDKPAGSRPLVEVPVVDPYQVYVANNRITDSMREVLVGVANGFEYQPTISLLMPVYNIERKWIQIAVESVRAQIYPRWELCIADDASTDPDLLEYLRSLTNDPRIKVILREENGHISAATNSAAEMATGEFIALLDNDDALAANALFEIARLLQTERTADLIYSDEDKIDQTERRYSPHFKPDWSPELLISYNYINHLTCIRRSVFEKAGRFRIGFEGSQDHDLLLRVVAETQRVHHIPKVLYHWRALPSSSATSTHDKVQMRRSGRAALKEYLARLGAPAQLYAPKFAQRLGLPINLLDWPDRGPSVAIIIPAYNKPELLKSCIASIKARTTYENYRIVVANNDSNDPRMLAYLEQLSGEGIEILPISNDGEGFSFSRVNNRAVEAVEDELVLLLNNDTEVLEPKWLSRMVGHLSFPGVGATGARLLYEDGSLQHAGILLEMQNGLAPDVAFLRHPGEVISYYFLAEVARNCVAVTGACLLVRRQIYREMGGLDEKNFAVSLNDVDFGLRLLARGLRTVYVAGAELRHLESRTRGRKDDPGEVERFRRMYAGVRDPFYNPNLSRVTSFAFDPGCHLDYDVYLEKPVRLLMAAHNLNLGEGAPKALYELATGLKARGNFAPIVFSPATGGYFEKFEAAGIPVRLENLALRNPGNLLEGWPSLAAYEMTVQRVQRVIEDEQPGVVVANTLHNFHMIEAARRAGVPSVWIIYESYSREKMAAVLDEFALEHCERAFVDATRIVFVSTDTSRLYQRYNSQHNFCVLNNGIDRAEIDAFMARVSKESARAEIGGPAGKKIITMVGTICDRKDQGTLVEAARLLRAERDDFCCYLVGLREGDLYSDRVKETVREGALEDVVRLIPTTDAHSFFRASDIFAFTSLVEGYSLAILEAEAFGLPIVSTLCPGVSEQMFDEVNGYLFTMSDPVHLANRLRTLLDDDALRERMSRNSRKVFDLLPSYAGNARPL